MEKSMDPVAARRSHHLVTVLFALSVLALVFAPALAARIQGGQGSLMVLFQGTTPQGAPTILRVLYLLAMLWFPVMWMLALAGGNWVWPVLTLFLLAGDIVLAVKLWKLRCNLCSNGFSAA